MKQSIKPALYIIGGTFIFVALPLLGWGINDVGKFFNHPVRLLYVMIIILLQAFAIIYNPRMAKEKEREKKNKVMPQSKIDLFLIQIFSLSIVFLAPYSDSRSIGVANLGDIVRYFGFAFILSGFFLMQLAEKYLDRQFSVKVTIQENHKLVRTGPYKYIRHPRYLGIIIFFTGISFVFRSYLAIGIIVMLSMVLAWRIFAEESLMKQEFEKEWDNYCATSWRLIPYLF